MPKSDNYYEKCTDHKRIKSEIVSKYLFPWAKIVGSHSEGLHYLDLFSGRGVFEDGTPATPILILNEIKDAAEKMPWIYEELSLSFYEGNRNHFDKLSECIKSHPTYRLLKNKPSIKLQIIDTNFISQISDKKEVGTYTFIDPFGFKGLTLDLIDTVTKEWGCDCLFYLSISGLVRNFERPEQKNNLQKFFGINGFKNLMNRMMVKKASESRGEIILNGIQRILSQKRKYYTVKYCVEFDNNRRKSHYLMFVSKNKRGFGIMRDIMIARGTKDRYGLPLLVFSPKLDQEQSQFELTLGFETLSLKYYSIRLQRDFEGTKIKFPTLADDCLARGYLLQNSHIKIVLRELENNGNILIERFDKDGNKRSGKNIIKYDMIYFKGR